MWLALHDRTDLFLRPQRVLHFAPESFLERRLRRVATLDYVTGDLQPGRAMHVVDVMAIPFPDESFDGVICSHVLEHVPDDYLALREIRRVLRPSGWALLNVPIRGRTAVTREQDTSYTAADRLREFGQEDHVRDYGLDWPDRIRTAGFEVTPDTRALGMSDAERARFGFQPETIWFAHYGAVFGLNR